MNYSGLHKDIKASAQCAYAPYSGFKVASIVFSSTGGRYTGVNVENVSYGLTSCAEQNAIGAMISAGEQVIEKIVIGTSDGVYCPPCGRCRQLIAEFSHAKTEVVLIHGDQVDVILADKLLPSKFACVQGAHGKNTKA